MKEWQRISREVADQFAIGDTPYENLVFAMSAVEREMNYNGGCNWPDGNYDEYLNTVRDFLLAEAQFTSDQMAKIRWAIDEIAACGRELGEIGESSRNATEAVEYLAARVVDWCHAHPKNHDA